MAGVKGMKWGIRKNQVDLTQLKEEKKLAIEQKLKRLDPSLESIDWSNGISSTITKLREELGLNGVIK